MLFSSLQHHECHRRETIDEAVIQLKHREAPRLALSRGASHFAGKPGIPSPRGQARPSCLITSSQVPSGHRLYPVLSDEVDERSRLCPRDPLHLRPVTDDRAHNPAKVGDRLFHEERTHAHVRQHGALVRASKDPAIPTDNTPSTLTCVPQHHLIRRARVENVIHVVRVLPQVLPQRTGEPPGAVFVKKEDYAALCSQCLKSSAAWTWWDATS